jgi:hypothetical protein
MGAFIDAIMRLLGAVAFWVIVQPWEQCLRVRMGKHVRMLPSGFHWRLPLIDTVFKQSVRMRTAMLPTPDANDGGWRHRRGRRDFGLRDRGHSPAL